MPEQTSAGSGSFLQYLAGNLRRNGRSPVRVYTGFVIAWALFFLFWTVLPPFPGLTHNGMAVLGIVLWASVMWVSEAMPTGITGISIPTLLLITQAIPWQGGKPPMSIIFAGFTNHVIWLCLREYKKGIPLGFYISQWLANYLLEPLDKLITETLGLDKLVRYMDDVTIYAAAKKALHNADVQIRKMLGQRFRLKLKKNRQVCKFFYQGKRKAMGRPLDFMGFVFYRDKTIIRKRIMLKATQTARHLHKAKEAGRSYCRHNIAAMLSYMGWFSCTDTYECFKRRIKPNVKIGKLKEIISKLDRRKKNHETLGNRSMLQPA